MVKNISTNIIFPLQVMKKRSDFLACARAKWCATRGMVVQARRRIDGNFYLRVGFTCTRKVGNAVARNRAKRRLREVARLTLVQYGRAGWDYVLIGRINTTVNSNFKDLINDFKYALRRLHKC